MAPSRPSIFRIIFVLFIALGVYTGVAIGRGRQNYLLARELLSLTPSPANGQVNLLIVGVDSLEASPLRLESLWLAIHYPDTASLLFLPLYPTPSTDRASPYRQPHDPISLRAADKREVMGLDVYRRQSPWVTEAVFVDRNGLAALINTAGGMDMNGAHLNGQEALSLLANPWQEPAAALDQQISLLEKLCQAPQPFSDLSNLEGLLRDYGAHFRIGAQFRLDVEWSRWAANQFAVNCEFPLR